MSGFSGKSVSAKVLQQAQRGDMAAHGLIYQAFSSPVYSLAARMTGSRSAAEDILQDCFLEVMKGLPGFRGDAALGTWIRRIAVSRSLMYLRTAWRRRATLFRDLARDDGTDWEPPAPRPADLGTNLDLEQALARLSDVSRIVVLLHDVEGYTHAEIAALMGLSESFSKSQLSRARARLRGFLAIDSDSPEVASDAASR
jgi:RNA polymerase sigma-70 factor (ECF subfamily)